MRSDDPMPSDLANLLSDLPEEIPPVRDLWETIEHDLAPEATEVTPETAPAPPRGAGIPGGILAAVAIAIGASWAASRTIDENDTALTAWEIQVRTATRSLIGSDDVRNRAVEAEVDRAIDAVGRALSGQSSSARKDDSRP